MKKRLVAVCSVITLVTFPALSAGQQPDPDSPRYQGALALQELIRSSGDGAVQSFLENWTSATLRSTHADDELLGMIRQVRKEFASATSEGARPTGEFSAELMFTSQEPGSRTSVEFQLESKPPHRFTDFGYQSPREASKREPPIGLTTELSDYMDDLVSKDEFSGTVLVAKDGEPIFKRAYGLASKRYDVPNRIDTKLNLGSMNKMFTGVSICQLAEQGKLSFDDKVIKHLPDYPNREVAENVTIHQLLTHTSGLGSYWNDKYEATWSTIRTLDQLLATFVDDPLKFEPGARFGYSNCGPVVLGLIIERITGQTYYDYVREHVYKPAGMLNTDCYAMDRPTPNLAIGYTNRDENDRRTDGPRRNNLFSHSLKGGPAGGGFSTVEDLLKFSMALQEHKLLSPEMTKTLLAGKVPTGPGSEYAYLFGDETGAGQRYVGHNGGAPGISAEFWFDPSGGYTVAVLANYDRVASSVLRFISGAVSRGASEASARLDDSDTPEVQSSGAPYRMGAMLRHSPDGMLIDALVPGAPSEKAGLRPGDIVLAMNGMSLAGDADSIITKVFSSPDVVTLLVRRGDQDLTIKLTPEPAP